MKKRKPEETDEQYIKRLEDSIEAHRHNAQILRRHHGHVQKVVTVTAARLGLLLDYAADMCGLARTEEHIKIKRLIGGLCWAPFEEMGAVELPEKLDWTVADPDPPSDAGMLLRSALEKCKAARAPWDVHELIPELGEEDLSRWDWETLGQEIADAIMDLECGRGFLRDDLRSAHMDHCVLRIGRAIREASWRKEREPSEREGGGHPPF